MHLISLPIAKYAVARLAEADYTIASKISEDVALFVPWALDHHLYWAADQSMHLLQLMDSIGGVWITIATWCVLHAH